MDCVSCALHLRFPFSIFFFFWEARECGIQTCQRVPCQWSTMTSEVLWPTRKDFYFLSQHLFFMKKSFSERLDWAYYVCVCVCVFQFFFFFLRSAFHVGMCLSVDLVHCVWDLLPFWTSKFFTKNALSVDPMHCSRDPQISFFTKTFIKNGSHNTIHIFKNYFVTVFSIFSFQQNKRYPNGP